ncbi:hypothetical protein EV421DRAFT_2038827 [Armillaria borealis]|uniref:Uncharacterized protein n=1 Tax=Armillaria borealis TaxID=47425 RepID=A0AA39J8N0_9AGAR|nr:hypothetical protein EV421DRAFT_2038827 [Armillaria borealis]
MSLATLTYKRAPLVNLCWDREIVLRTPCQPIPSGQVFGYQDTRHSRQTIVYFLEDDLFIFACRITLYWHDFTGERRLPSTAHTPFLVEVSGVPYIDKARQGRRSHYRATREKSKKNKEDVKELYESITDTVGVIDTLVCMHRGRGAAYFKDICVEMERYLTGIADDLKDAQRKHRGIKGFLKVSDLRDTIQGYRKHVDNLKIDFLIHISGDSMLALIEIQGMLSEMRNMKDTASKEESVIIRITITRADFFCIRALVSDEPGQLTAPYNM